MLCQILCISHSQFHSSIHRRSACKNHEHNISQRKWGKTLAKPQDFKKWMLIHQSLVTGSYVSRYSAVSSLVFSTTKHSELTRNMGNCTVYCFYENICTFFPFLHQINITVEAIHSLQIPSIVWLTCRDFCFKTTWINMTRAPLVSNTFF